MDKSREVEANGKKAKANHKCENSDVLVFKTEEDIYTEVLRAMRS